MFRGIILTSLLFLISCGEALNKRRKIVYEDSVNNSLLNCPINQSLSPLFSDYEKIKGINSEYLNKVENIVPVSGQKFFDEKAPEPLSPYISNVNYLESILKRLNTKQNEIKDMPESRRREFELLNLKDNLKKFYEKLVRYNNLLCDKEQFRKKENQDVRSFYFLQHVLKSTCDNKLVCLSQKIIENGSTEFFNNYLKMCSATQKVQFCYDLLMNREELQSNLPSLFDNFEKNKITPFFIADIRGPKFDCEINTFSKKMTIVLSSSEITLTSDELQILAKYWSLGSDMIINFIFSNNVNGGDIEIKVTNRGVSFVNSSESNKIFISNLILSDRQNFVATLAHEIGHVLGLPDCYLEFLDETPTAFYYSLDETNLMCSIGPFSRVNSQALVSIFKNRCK